jgi:pimeloyl-ACP methyl ester carboxylesterase
MNGRPNIVLVHGAWADGSCWSGVIERLQADGYHVTAPQFPLTSTADDVARLRQVLNLQDGPTIVVGHSYGGQIMTALGTDAPNVAGLVYIAAFGLDNGESLAALLSQGPTPPALAHLFTDKQGFMWQPQDDFVQHFAADVDPVRAKVMHSVQQPIAGSAFNEAMGVPAWKSLPSWYLVATRTRRSRRTRSSCSPAAWARPPSKSLPATSRWFLTPMKRHSSSRRQPKPGPQCRRVMQADDKSHKQRWRPLCGRIPIVGTAAASS